MKILFIGDIVGQPGIEAVRQLVPKLIADESLDLVIANAENACSGSGLTPKQHRQLRAAGIENLNVGGRYFVVVRAINSSGQVSGPSTEVNGLATDVLPAMINPPAVTTTPPRGAILPIPFPESPSAVTLPCGTCHRIFPVLRS